MGDEPHPGRVLEEVPRKEPEAGVVLEALWQGGRGSRCLKVSSPGLAEAPPLPAQALDQESQVEVSWNPPATSGRCLVTECWG